MLELRLECGWGNRRWCMGVVGHSYGGLVVGRDGGGD